MWIYISQKGSYITQDECTKDVLLGQKCTIEDGKGTSMYNTRSHSRIRMGYMRG